MRCLTIAMAVPVFTLCALADVAPPPPKPSCDDAMSNLEMRMCSHAEFIAADKELNAVYRRVLKHLKETYGPDEIKNAGGQDPVADLRDAQRKWVAFRDANCRSLGTHLLGGSGQPVIEGGCRASMTKERVTELKSFLPD